MRRSIARALAFPLVLVLVLAAAAADDVPRDPEAPRWVLDVADAVLAHHIDPPARQQLVLLGIKAAYARAGLPAPAGLGRRVSALATPEQFQALIEETWSLMPAGKKDEALARAFADAMLQALPGGGRLYTAREAKVAQQIEGNLYVGIQIALSLNEKESRPQVAQVFEGGPAQRAGVLDGDLLVAIDGKDTLKVPLVETVDWLRGEEGTDLEIKVRRPESHEVRTYTLTRGRLMRPTVSGVRKRPSGGWDVRVDGPDPIGYLKLDTITGSTPQELRRLARQLESEGIRALVLDLRSRGASLHPTVLLADALLESGTIGQVRTADRVTSYRADPDALFRGWPLAVVIDQTTSGPAEWLAAALQDNHRAVLVGASTRGNAAVRSFVPIAGDAWMVEMTTQTLERADGRSIGNPWSSFPPALAPLVSPLVSRAGAVVRERESVRMLANNQTRISERAGVTPDHKPVSTVKVEPGKPGVRPAPVAPGPAVPELMLDQSVARAVQLLRETLIASDGA